MFFFSSSEWVGYRGTRIVNHTNVMGKPVYSKWYYSLSMYIYMCVHTCISSYRKIPFEAKLEQNSALLYCYFLKWFTSSNINFSNHYFQNTDTSFPKYSFSRNCTEAWVHLSDCFFLVLCLNLLTVAEILWLFLEVNFHLYFSSLCVIQSQSLFL